MQPVERVRNACARWGEAVVASDCAALLRSGTVLDGRLLDLAMALGELTDRDWFEAGKPPGHAYWARVWAARALLYVWTDEAAPAVVTALADEQWRVREMAAKVTARREIGTAADRLAGLSADPVPRVRAAAACGLAEVGEAEHADVLHRLAEDPDPLVARTAGAALGRLSRRLDRDLD